MGTVEEMFHGFWHGQEVSFPRVFRGHRFTDEECMGLCFGDTVEVHNLDGKYGKYGVVGRLGLDNLFGEVRFQTHDSILNNPDYVYHMHKPKEEDYHGYAVMDDMKEMEVVLDDKDLHGISFSETYEEPLPVLDESVTFDVSDVHEISNVSDDLDDFDEDDDTDGFNVMSEEDDFDYELLGEEENTEIPQDFEDSDYDEMDEDEYESFRPEDMPNFENPPMDGIYGPNETIE